MGWSLSYGFRSFGKTAKYRLLKIIGIDDQGPLKPLGIRQVFILNSICKQYNDLKSEYVLYSINTSFKSVEIPKHNLTIGQRSYSYFSKDYFNKLPNELNVTWCVKSKQIFLL